MNREHLLSSVRHPAAILSLALALLVPRVAVLAQQNLPSTRPDEPVAEVRVRGNHNVPMHKIMAEIRTRPGLPPDEKLLQEDVRRLIATRQFFDVGVEYLHESHGLVVLFRVLEGNQIREVVFEGNRAFDAEKLRDKAGLYPDKKASDDAERLRDKVGLYPDKKAGDKKSEKKPDPKKPLAIDIARAKDAARTLEDFYHEKGYPFAKVELVEGMQPGDKRLLFRVSEGPKVVVTDVDFEFLDHNTFGGRRLATQIKSKPRKFGFLGGRYNGHDIEDDVHRLGSYYRNLGFFDAKVSRELRESEDRSKVQVLFVIQEGPRYQVRSIEFAGNKKLDREKLAEGLKLEVGQPFQQQKLQADAQKVQDKYGALGHIEAKVVPDIRFTERPGEADVVYQITEGEPYSVGRIIVTGNQTTKDTVIRREVRLYPGELIDTTLLRKSESNLRKTQLFLANYQQGTGPTLTPIGEGPNLRDIELKVDEGQTGRLLFGFGVNSDAGLVGNIIISEQNFDITRFPASFGDVLAGDAFRGGGQEFRLEAAPGTQFSRYLISWREPKIFDLPYSFGVSGHFFQRNYREYDEERAGGTFTLGHEFTDRIRGTLGLRVENVTITKPAVPTPADLAEILGDNFITAFTVGAEHDTRDNPFMPTSGHLAAVSFEQGVGDFTFPKVSLEGRKYWTLHERPDGSGKQVLSARGTVGFESDNTPMFERFYAGGFRNFRGFRFRGVGPVGENNANVHVGGDFMMLGSVEYSMPITADDNLQLALFSDFGTVEESVKITDFRVTAGFGLRVVVPMLGPVPLAFDFAFPVHSADTDDQQVFSFMIGIFR